MRPLIKTPLLLCSSASSRLRFKNCNLTAFNVLSQQSEELPLPASHDKQAFCAWRSIVHLGDKRGGGLDPHSGIGQETAFDKRNSKHTSSAHRAAPPGGDKEPSFMDVIGDAQAAAAPIEVPQAATNAHLRARCIDQSGLCVLALLDANNPNFEKQLAIVRDVGGRWKKQPLHFSWVDAARQVSTIPEVELPLLRFTGWKAVNLQDMKLADWRMCAGSK